MTKSYGQNIDLQIIIFRVMSIVKSNKAEQFFRNKSLCGKSSLEIAMLTLLLSIIQYYMGLCVFSLPISLVVIERIYILSFYHHQIGSMNYYPLFRVR